VVDRHLESKLLDVLGTRSSRVEDWRPLGPSFFLAGLAVTVASVPGFDRRRYLDLAESLPPARFLPMLQARSSHAA